MDFRELNENIRDVSKYIIVIVIAILLFNYVISFMQIFGPSMNNTLSEGDLIFVSKLHYKIGNVKRGDIIVFEHNGVKNLVKRVIGIPGDKVFIKNNTLYINDQAYEESYLNSDMITYDFNICSLGDCTVPENSYFVLGDNRVNSQDSREIGYISKDQIVGKAVMRFWPITSFKKL